MAAIYTKSGSDKTLILSPQEYMMRPFNFGTDWTQIRVGILWSMVATGGDNTQAGDEDITVSTPVDRYSFGIKNSTTTDLPGVAGSSFLGATNGGTYHSRLFNGGRNIGSGDYPSAYFGFHGATPIGSTSSLAGNLFTTSADASGANDYCGATALSFTITNRGLSTQSIVIGKTEIGVISGDIYTAGALRTLMNSAAYNATSAIPWNDGSAAYDIPDAFWLRMPFFNNRIRLSAHRVDRIN